MRKVDSVARFDDVEEQTKGNEEADGHQRHES